jgi:predicted DsbA family dithiol-disulfide isomerase
VSDVICPWCFIGKPRLEKALPLPANPSGVQGIWKPFQLNSRMSDVGRVAEPLKAVVLRQLLPRRGVNVADARWPRGAYLL